MLLLAALADVPLTATQDEVYAVTRDRVLVDFFGARPGFGSGPDEHRFRIDDHWPPED